MSPRNVPPKGPQHSAYLEFLKAFGNQELPGLISGRDEYTFLWDQWHRARRAERTASRTWFETPPVPVPKTWTSPDTSPPPVRPAIPTPEESREPEPEEEAVAPPAPQAPPKRKGRFQTLEL